MESHGLGIGTTNKDTLQSFEKVVCLCLYQDPRDTTSQEAIVSRRVYSLGSFGARIKNHMANYPLNGMLEEWHRLWETGVPVEDRVDMLK